MSTAISELPWSPMQIPGCALWLDGADSNSVIRSGNSVTQWRDKSGNGNHFGNVGVVTYSRNRLEFNSTYLENGAISGFSSGATSPMSSFIVFNYSSSSFPNSGQSAILFTYGTVTCTQTGYAIYVDQINSIAATFFCGALMVNNAIVAATDYLVSDVVTYTGTSGSFTRRGFLNGNAMTTTNASTTGVNLSGSVARIGFANVGDKFIGNIAEIVYFNRTVTDTQRQLMEGYLAHKWGLDAGLPASHLHVAYRPLLHSLPANLLTSRRGFSVNAVPVFVPTQIPGCALWLDAADSSTLTLSGTNVTQWRDKSGNGHILTGINTNTLVSSGIQITGSVSGGSGTLSGFTNSTVSVSISNRSVFLVFTQTLSQYAQFVGFGPSGANIFSSNDRFRYAVNPGGNSVDIYANNGSTLAFGTTVGAAPALQRTIFADIGNNSPPNVSFFVNGSTAGTGNFGGTAPTSVSAAGFQIARLPTGATAIANEFFNGVIHEIIVYNSTITTAQREQIEAYLAWKWGLQANLVNSHRFGRNPIAPFANAIFRIINNPFQPIDITGCTLWLDAADISTISLSGTTVTQWRDKSRNLYHTSVVGGSPIYSSNSILLNGTSSYLAGPYVNTTQTLTAYVVANVNFYAGNYANYYRLLSVGSTAANDYNNVAYSAVILHEPNTINIGGYRNGQQNYTATVSQTDFILANQYDGSTSTLYMNGATAASIASTGAFNTSSYSIGRDVGNTDSGGSFAYWPGAIREVILFNKSLSIEERQTIERYLSSKWNINIAVPLTIPGCSLWLDAADTTTFSFSGSSITQWRDKSITRLVGTAVNSPALLSNGLNGLQAVALNGTNQYFNFGNFLNLGTAPIHVFAVSKYDSTADGSIISKSLFGASTGRWYLSRFSGNGGIEFVVNATTGTTAAVKADTSTSPRILNGSWDRSTIALHENGRVVNSKVFADSTTLSTAHNLFVGVYNDANGTGPQTGTYFNGKLGEILVFQGSLTAIQRQTIESYLSNKWNINVAIPLRIPGCVVWFDGADTSTITGTTSVTQWVDKVSGIIATPTAGGATLGTFNNNSMIRIPAGSELGFTASLGQARSWFVVIRNDTQLSASITPFGLIHGYANSNQQITIVFSSNIYSFINNNPGTAVITSVNSIPNPFNRMNLYSIVSSAISTASNVMAVNGTSQTLNTNTLASGWSTSNRFTVSRADFNSAVSVCEIIGIDGEVTTAQRQQVESYLSKKWSVYM